VRVSTLFAVASGALLTATAGLSWFPLKSVDLFYHDRYYVVPIWQACLWAGIGFLAFAAVSRLFLLLARRPLGRTLGLVHFWLTLASVCTLLAASVAIANLDPSSLGRGHRWIRTLFLVGALALFVGAAAQFIFVANVATSPRRLRGLRNSLSQ